MSKNWTTTLVNKEKAAVRKLVQQHSETPAKKLEYIDKQIRLLKEMLDGHSRLQCYIFIMSALVHHERHGGLSDSKIRSYSEVAETLLKIQGIEIGSSRLSYLFGELFLVNSQIARGQGNHWRSLWQQQLSYQVIARPSESDKKLRDLAVAIRSLRLGNADFAATYFLQVEKNNAASSEQFHRARLGRIQCLRLSSEVAACESLIEESKNLPELSPQYAAEIKWEKDLCKIAENGDIRILLNATQKSSSDKFSVVYAVEAILWALTQQKRDFTERFPKLSTLAKNSKIKPQELGVFFECAIEIERCYDTEFPFSIRLRRLGAALEKCHKILTIDRELLIWAAAIRWLIKNNAPVLANACISEYENKCLRLSSGKCRDVLGTLSDIFEKWQESLSA